MTTGGAGTILVVGIAHHDGKNTSVSGVTFAGITLTFEGVQAEPGGSNAMEIWTLAAPPAGTGTVTVTLTKTVEVAAGAISFTGVSSTAPVASFTSTSSKNGSPALGVVGSTNQTLVDVLSINGNANSATPNAAGQVLQWSQTTTTSGSGIIGGSSTKPGGLAGGMSWSVGQTTPWALGAIILNPGC